MLKKNITIALILFANTYAIANPDKILQLKNDNPISTWSINAPYWSPWGILLPYPHDYTSIVILYVNETNESGLASDPVLVDCNGIPTMVNPGVSTVCKLGLHGTMNWKINSDYRHNGAQGSLITLS